MSHVFCINILRLNQIQGDRASLKIINTMSIRIRGKQQEHFCVDAVTFEFSNSHVQEKTFLSICKNK